MKRKSWFSYFYNDITRNILREYPAISENYSQLSQSNTTIQIKWLFSYFSWKEYENQGIWIYIEHYHWPVLSMAREPVLSTVRERRRGFVADVLMILFCTSAENIIFNKVLIRRDIHTYIHTSSYNSITHYHFHYWWYK